jgi:hypothetical protein
MKSFFNKKINLILTIILIALIIYNLFNRPLIEGNTPENTVPSSEYFPDRDGAPSGGHTIIVSGATSSRNNAHVKSVLMSQLATTSANSVGLNKIAMHSNIGKIKEKQTNQEKKLASLNAVND